MMREMEGSGRRNAACHDRTTQRTCVCDSARDQPPRQRARKHRSRFFDGGRLVPLMRLSGPGQSASGRSGR